MAKVKLGQRPKNFPQKVCFPMLDGTSGEIEMQYVYRTRKEYGALHDEIFGEQSVVGEEASASGLAAALERVGKTNAEYILRIATGWDLEAPFNAESLEQLADELPGGVLAIIGRYGEAITQGRVGN